MIHSYFCVRSEQELYVSENQKNVIIPPRPFCGLLGNFRPLSPRLSAMPKGILKYANGNEIYNDHLLVKLNQTFDLYRTACNI